MAKIIVVLKAILTRIIFGAHGLIAIWRVTKIKKDPYYWYLTASIMALGFEGIFTLTIKKNQEWKWFCPSVFFYLCSVVPAIWLIEVDKFDRKLEKIRAAAAGINMTAAASEEFPGLEGLQTLGVDVKIPIQIDAEMWVTVIEQFLMLILIIGRWMLPKGGLTRDQLSQLLLVYIGTAADIIEFFDSFKDDKISSHRILCLLILSIWSWSLLQFTFVLTATKARRTRITTEVKETPKLKIVNGIIKVKEVCCNIDVWAILINIILQDAPFLIFRALLILYYKIISYMNIFFTCKNTLVIILQFYRLYVVQQEKNKELSKMQKAVVSKNVANAVERAAMMGPQNEGKKRLVKNPSSGKRAGKGPSSRQAQNKVKHRSQDSISSQNTNKSSSRRDRNGRRRSLSAGNLPEVGEGETFEERIYEDDIELGMSGSAMSGTNDPDSQDEEESEVPIDEVSIASERPRGIRKNIRMSENPGIYKISGSRSSGSSERGHGRYRQDTGYSSSSKDSGNSGGRRGRQHSSNNAARSSGRAASGNNRARSSAQRRRQFISSKYCNSIEFGEYEGIFDQLRADAQEPDPVLDNERLWQRRSAIGVVFFLFVVIFILCMVAIYGGINPRGLVLRENFRIRKTTRPTTTTPEPSTEIMIATTSATTHNKTILVAAASVSPSCCSGENETESEQFNNDTLSETAFTLDSSNDVIDDNNNTKTKIDTRNNGIQSTVLTPSPANVDSDGDDIITVEESLGITGKTSSSTTSSNDDIISTTVDRIGFGGKDYNSNRLISDKYFRHLSEFNSGYARPEKRHGLRHKLSRIFKFVAGDINDFNSNIKAWDKGQNIWRRRKDLYY